MVFGNGGIKPEVLVYCKSSQCCKKTKFNFRKLQNLNPFIGLVKDLRQTTTYTDVLRTHLELVQGNSLFTKFSTYFSQLFWVVVGKQFC